MTPPLWSLKSCKLGNWVVTCPLLLLLDTLQPLKLVDEIALWNKAVTTKLYVLGVVVVLLQLYNLEALRMSA